MYGDVEVEGQTTLTCLKLTCSSWHGSALVNPDRSAFLLLWCCIVCKSCQAPSLFSTALDCHAGQPFLHSLAGVQFGVVLLACVFCPWARLAPVTSYFEIVNIRFFKQTGSLHCVVTSNIDEMISFSSFDGSTFNGFELVFFLLNFSSLLNYPFGPYHVLCEVKASVVSKKYVCSACLPGIFNLDQLIVLWNCCLLIFDIGWWDEAVSPK